MTHSLSTRVVALLLSWVFPATSVWAAAPPGLPSAERAVHGPRGSLLPAGAVDVKLPRGLPARAAGAERPAPRDGRDAGSAAGEEHTFGTGAPARRSPGEEPRGVRVAALDPGAYAAGGGGAQGEPTTGCEAIVFGPRRYTRTTGAPNVYTDTFAVPSWVESPWVLRAINGDAQGDHRVSSARIRVNGSEIARPSDFNPHVDVIERPVALSPSSTLEVTLSSKPRSFLTLSLCGANGDHTPPELAVAAPPDGSVIGDATPDLLVRYDDPVGAGEPGASGVETRTLEVSLDELDRTSLFTVLPDRATATLPQSMALDEGLHEVWARVEDAAGNQRETLSRFRVDLTPPVIQITEPSPGVVLNAASVPVRVVFSDDVELDLSTLVIRLNGADRTSLFDVTPNEAQATLGGVHGLVEGANQITAEIRDRAGHRAPSGVEFSIDTVPPEVVIGEPLEGSRHGSASVEVAIEFRDEQAVDPETFGARLDGEVVTLTEGPGWATGWLGPLDDGEHELVVTVRDYGKNPGTAVSRFWVDTTLPTIQITQPAPASFSNDRWPLVLVMFEDAEGIDPETLLVEVDGVDRTGVLEVGESWATGKLPPELGLEDGPHQVFARVRDLAKNEGTDTSEFTIDTQPPEGVIEAPSDPTNESPPTVRITYTDPGDHPSGVDTASVVLFVDDVDETARLTVGPAEAVGHLDLEPPLADGLHRIRVELKDRARNPSTFIHDFLLDTTEPMAQVQSPGIATHDTTPEVQVTFADGGSGVDLDSVGLFLRRGDDPEVPLADVVVTDTSATATVPEAGALDDGSWTLRAVLADLAGNVLEIQHAFVVDTVSPTASVEDPPAGVFVATSTPALLVTYEDDRSGIDPSALQVWIDGVDLTSRFTADDLQATGLLEAGDALEEGPHALTVHVFDRAGNPGVVENHPFSVDTVPPVASIVEPAAAYLAASPATVRAVYSDTGAGIDPLSVRVLVDGEDRTAEFAVSESEALGTLEPPLVDGTHTVTLDVEDGAGNPPETTPSVTFTVDTLPPAVAVSSPDDDAYLAESPVTVSGTVQDADPLVAVTCEGESGTVEASVEAGAFSCTLSLTEGENDLVVLAEDRFRGADPVTLTVHLDTQPPEVMILQPPVDPFFTSLDTVDVSGSVQDASPIASVLVNGVEAMVDGASFAAASVPVAATLQAVATDAAGHTGTATVNVVFDVQPPSVEITSPAEGVWVRGPEVEVTGTVADDLSPTMVEVNGQPELDPSQELSRTFQATVSASDGPLTLQARAFDAAGNPADSVPRNVSVDSAPPLVIIEDPAVDPLVTKESSVRVAGQVDDRSPVTLLVDGQPTVPVAGRFERDVALDGEGERVLVATATDAVGFTGGDGTTVWVDRTAPSVEVLSPEEGDLVFALPVVVQGTVSDLPDGVPANTLSVTVDGQPATFVDNAWQVSIGGLPDGPHAFQIVATDRAGNTTTLPHPVVMDLLPPTVSITSPLSGTLTRLATIAVEGTVTGRGTITVEVRSGSTTFLADASGGSWSVPAFPLAEGDNTLVAVARGESGRTSEPDYTMVTLDTIPPTLELHVPETVPPGSPGAGLVTAVDNRPGVIVVEVQIDGTTVASGPAPLAFEVLAPEGTPPGSTLVVSATATDAAGNPDTISKGVKVAGEGVVVGQVLADETSLPLEGATVDLEGASGSQSATTDAQGRFRFLTGDAETRVRATAAERTEVEREVALTPEVGTVMIDARLTPLAEAVMAGVDGGALPEVTLPPPSELGLTVSLAAGVLTEETPFHLTPLSPQGLPILLPLGWSPVAAFDLRLGAGAAPASPPMQATFSGLGTAPVHLVRLDEGTRAWEMVAGDLVPTDGSLTVPLPGPGAYALAVPDADPAPEVPVEGMLTGVEMQELPATAVGEGTVEPSVVPPSGGVARGRLQVRSPLPLPSGTVVQADVIEAYSLASGEEASTEIRREDIVLYAAPGDVHVSRAPPEEGTEATGAPLCPEGALCADFPIAASRTYDPGELVAGEVRLDVLAGRESIRGETGGSRALTHEGAGGAIVEIPALALPEDTVVEVERTELSPFLPVSGDAEPLAEVVLDLAGASLATSATLSVEGAVAAGETVVVARVVRLAGVPKLLAVALGQPGGDRIESVPVAGLPGVREEGRYAFYRVPTPMGFATGETTLSEGGSVSAWVEGGGLPFMSRSGVGTPYLLPTLAGPVVLQAYAPGPPPLTGQGSGEVLAGGPETAAAVPLVLEGRVTTATVTPADGALHVPVTTFVELQASAPLFEEADFAPRVRLETAAGDPVAARYLLSGSHTRLAVIPLATLAFSTTYRVVVTELRDTYGAAVQVGSSSFTTTDYEAPSFDADALVFSFPDADGFVTITAPAGSFPPGSEVLILNAGNGDVATFQVDNDGGLGLLAPATLRASIDHRLLVTITDPLGNVTTFERSKFVDPETGETAIGPGGGTVDAADASGVELRIPAGALTKGAHLKVEGRTAEELAQEFPGQTPDLGTGPGGAPLARVAGGIKITSPDTPTFEKPIDLAFPLPDFAAVPEEARPPAESPEDAYYYVVRRVEGPCEDGSESCDVSERKIVFQTIDHAFVECPEGQETCEASEKRVVTASYPFSGYLDSNAVFGVSPAGALAVQPAIAAFAYLLWSFEKDQPGAALPGAVTGKVLRARWDPGATVPEYDPVKGAVVTAVDAGGQRLLSGNAPMAVSGRDGTFTLWDPRYVGGPVPMAATVVGGDVTSLCSPPAPPNPEPNPDVACGMAYEANPADWKTSGLRFHQNIATVNLALPAIEPAPPPPAVEIRVFRTVENVREDTRGLVGQDTPLVIGVTPSAGAEVREVRVQGSAVSFRADPLRGEATGMDWIAEYVPGNVGTYRVEATALTPALEVITGTTTFRVIGAGGTDDIVEGQPPEVIPDRTVPKSGARGVGVSTFLQVVFTEPVRKIAGHVTLEDDQGQPVAVRISGTLRFGGIVEDLQTSPDAVVTGLTLQPLVGLRYGTPYTLRLTDGIEDLDATPAPLVPYETSFETFRPESLIPPGEGETYGSPGIVVLGERAYLVENHFYSGTLKAYEATDPVDPREIESARYSITYRPVDIVGEATSPVTGGRLVAVSTGPPARSTPSNVWLFDVSDDASTQWVGAVSLTSSAGDGFISRTFMRNGFLYAATYNKGLQIVDLGKVIDGFQDPGTNAYFQMVQALFTDGRGYGQENVVGISVDGRYGAARLEDLEAGPVGPEGRVTIVATGDTGLTLADPGTLQVLSSGAVHVAADDATLTQGYALGLARVEGYDLAVVAGSGTAQGEPRSLVMVVDISNPAAPVGLGWTALENASVADIIIKDDLALLGGSARVTVVSLTDPSHPRVTGIVSGVGGRLALTDTGLIFSTARSVFGGDTELGGIRTAALEPVTVITKIDPNPALLLFDGELAEEIRFRYRAIPPQDELLRSTLEFLVGPDVVAGYDAPLNVEGEGGQAVPPDFTQPPDVILTARLRVETTDASAAPRPLPRVVERETFDVQPAVAEAIQYGDVLEITAVHQGLLERRAEDPSAPLPQLVWRGPGILYPAAQQESGLYSTNLPLSGLAGGRGPLSLVDDSNRVYGQTGGITLLPGWPVTGALSASSSQLPADGRSEITLALEDVRDGAIPGGPGNIILDDTPVHWEILGDGGGELIGAAESVTLAGRATVQYRAGIDPGPVVVRAALDVPGQEWYRDITIDVAPLEGEITFPSPGEVIFRIWSAAGPPADGTPVGWITYRGQVEGWIETEGGEALAQWSEWPEEYFRDGARRDRFVYVGATVGRSRAGKLLDTSELADLPPGPLVLMDSDSVLLDSMPAAQTTFAAAAAQAVPPPSPFPGQATARVSRGTPFGTQRIALGTTRYPAVEPIAAYPLDAIVDGTTPDIYGGPGAEVGAEVELDSSHPQHQPAAFQVMPPAEPDGPPALQVTSPTVLALDSDFGLSGWVRFDAVDAGQVVFEKAGSYGLEVIDDGIDTRLEFYVMSGGARRTVRSRVALEPDRWFHFAAHSRDGRLALATTGDDVVALGDEVGIADPSANPLQIGVWMSGNLDELAIYDFLQSPMVVFANGQTEIDVPLDENGDGQAEVYGRGAFEALSGLSAGLSTTGRAYFAVQTSEPLADLPDDPFARRLRRVPVRVYVAPGPDERPEAYWSAVSIELGISVRNCLDGIGTGEGDLISQQTACDLFAGLIPGTEVPFAFRDLFRSAMNFVDGKETAADYIRGGFALIQLAVSVVPAARSVGTAFSKARLAIQGTPAELIIAREAAEKVTRIVADPAAEAAESAMIKILASEADDEARDALLYLLDDSLLTTVALSRGGGAVRGVLGGPPLAILAAVLPSSALSRDTVKALANVLDDLAERGRGLDAEFVKAFRKAVTKDPELGREIASRAIRQLRQLFGKYGAKSLRLTDDAVEGLAYFTKHTNSETRLLKMWQELVDPKYGITLTPDEAGAVMEQFFTNVKKLADTLKGLPPTRLGAEVNPETLFHNLLARGAGTSRTFRSTSGAYHSVAQVLREIEQHPGAVLEALDSAHREFAGRPDLILRINEVLRQFEFKWIKRKLRGRELSQLQQIADAAYRRALQGRGGTLLKRLKTILNNTVYQFPESVPADVQQALVEQIRGKIAGGLPEELKKAAESVVVIFEGTMP